MSTIPPNLLGGWDILVVDDDIDSLTVASMILEYYGASVHTAMNGLQALERLNTDQPQLIILDLSMPEMDGWELMKHISDHPVFRAIPTIALTAYDHYENKRRAKEVGFRSYLVKPLTASIFMNELLSLLLDTPEFVQYLNI